MAVRPIRLLIIAIFTTACLASSVIYQNDSSPSCTQVLDENGFAVMLIQQSTYSGVRLFDIVYTRKLRHNSCVIGKEGHNLRIKFDLITRTTDVLISIELVSDTEENSFGVSLWQGSNSVRCKLTAGVIANVSKFTLAAFSCQTARHPNGVEANAIEISSNQREKVVDLEYHKKSGHLGWLVLKQNQIDERRGGHSKNCMPPALYPGQVLEPNKALYDPGENVTIVCQSVTGQQSIAHAAQRTCLNTGHWSGDHVKCQQQSSPSKDCHPVEPYPGMPPRYSDYRLVLNGSINELLLRYPCRDGYEHVGQLSDVKQCRDGNWTNKHFPKCEPTAKKPPPEVDHAKWYAVFDENRLMKQVIYICERGYGPSTTKGVATYSVESKKWIDVPECRKLQDSSERDPATIILIVAAVVFVALLVLFIVYQKTPGRRDREASPDQEAQVLDPQNQEHCS